MGRQLTSGDTSSCAVDDENSRIGQQDRVAHNLHKRSLSDHRATVRTEAGSGQRTRGDGISSRIQPFLTPAPSSAMREHCFDAGYLAESCDGLTSRLAVEPPQKRTSGR